jgi:hypothetical protein
MRKDNAVSVWVGHFDSEKEFSNYIRSKYDEDGDEIPSDFMKAFEIYDLNPDFQEVLFQENLSGEDLRQASYAETFVDRLGDLSGNCAVLLYDYDYAGIVREANKLRFLGTFNYTK